MTTLNTRRSTLRRVAFAVLAAIAAVSSGCGSDSTSNELEADDAAAFTGTTYESPTDIVAAISDNVAECEAQDPPDVTGYSALIHRR